jgi:CheY-like chemotaxis protein
LNPNGQEPALELSQIVYNLEANKEQIMKGEPVLVMLVEDNIDHAELVIRTLEDHRIANKVIHFLDGQTALDYLLRRNEYENPEVTPRPHMILLDLRLPGIDGLEVLRLIKEQDELKNIPVIVLTTSEAEKDVARAYNNHVNSYLVKPVGYDEFSKLMNDLGFYWLGWNTHPLE